MDVSTLATVLVIVFVLGIGLMVVGYLGTQEPEQPKPIRMQKYVGTQSRYDESRFE